jgi:hypothetical protein
MRKPQNEGRRKSLARVGLGKRLRFHLLMFFSCNPNPQCLNMVQVCGIHYHVREDRLGGGFGASPPKITRLWE